ncbi:hypothetical protein SNOG_11496 [Parastagonospora nodorum SN15]|uniref:Uncharacterized protein n=1 Tax=Phaeosphaeria nodorum (strain SN15 / ATCC MYA-4574 / FGSC 10173) TaxID=321614 RepID=Q0U9R8_PHANO|nr:hypothetical protein SNOG_11496 [Parastagonospora nodorum SN15]EAT81204.1 hypothetical protein SNOG_11496 [Parastagonospora nodorum SN15]
MAQTTSVRTASPTLLGQTGTVFVQVPEVFTTLTSRVTGIPSPSTITIATPTAIGQTGTVVVEVPELFTTLTSLVPGISNTTTITIATPTAIGQTGIVVVEVPAFLTTLTSLVPGISAPITSTITTPSLPGQTGTVVIQVPLLFTTLTSLVTGISGPVTSTIATPSLAGQTGTILVELPPLFTTVTAFNPNGSDTMHFDCGILVEVPQLFTTLTSFNTPGVSRTITSTLAAPSVPGQIGTILVQIPQQFTTLTSLNTPGASGTVTSILATPTIPGQTGTVLVQIPQQFITLTSLNTIGALGNRYVRLFLRRLPLGRVQVTIVLQIPPEFTTVTSLLPADGTIISPLEQSLPRQLLVKLAQCSSIRHVNYCAAIVCRTNWNSGSTNSAAVYDDYNPEHNTRCLASGHCHNFAAHSNRADGHSVGRITASIYHYHLAQYDPWRLRFPPLATLTSPTAISETGIVLVLLPPQFTTVTSVNTALGISAATTRTLASPTAVNQTGTVVIEVPARFTTLTSLNLTPGASSPITTTIALPTNAGDIGTVVVQVLPQYTTVTQLNSASGFTAPATSTAANFQPHQAKSALLMVQVPALFTTITQLKSRLAVASIPITSTAAIPTAPRPSRHCSAVPTAPGQFGTIIVQVPSLFTTVTSFNPVSGATATITSTAAIPSGPGQTGTIIIEIPRPFVTITSLNPDLGATGIITLTQGIPTAVGQTGTVLVEVPQPFTTITSYTVGITTAVRTTAATPTSLGQTGTVVVLLPIPNTPVSIPVTPTSLPSSLSSAAPSVVVVSSQTVSVPATKGVSSFRRRSDQSLTASKAPRCFTGSLVQSLTGANVYNCIQSRVPSCANCLPALPRLLQESSNGTTSVLDTIINHYFGPVRQRSVTLDQGIASLCFAVSSTLTTLTGSNVFRCLSDSVVICPSSAAAAPSSLIATVSVSGCGATPTTRACLTGLPSSCQPSNQNNLLGSVLGTVDTATCQLALGLYGTTNAAVCFTSSLLNIFTGTDFLGCLNNHLPLCQRCVQSIPSACDPSRGYLGGVCQSALGYFGDTFAGNCFANGVLNSTITSNVISCLNNVLPFCNPPTTSTITRGSVALTTTFVTATGGILGVGESTFTVVQVVVPTPPPVLSTSFTTFIGSIGYTTTRTITSGSVLSTTTIISAGTTFAEIILPTSPLSRVTTTFVGPADYTSLATTTVGGVASTYVLVGIHTVLPTITVTSGTVPTAAPLTVTTVVSGASVIEVIVPTPFSTSSQTGGLLGFTSTITGFTTVSGTARPTTTYVLVNRPGLGF